MDELELSRSSGSGTPGLDGALPDLHAGFTDPTEQDTWVAAPSCDTLNTTLQLPLSDPECFHSVDATTLPPLAEIVPIQASQTRIGAEPIFQPQLFGQALKEVGAMHATTLEEWSEKLNLSPAGQALAVAATTTALTAGVYLSPSVTLGLVGSAIILHSIGHEQNTHSRAQGILGGVLYTSHLGLIGAWEAVVSSCVGITRSLFQSMIPDSYTRARGTFALVSLGASVGVFALLTDLTPMVKVSNLPLFATCLSSISGAFSVRYSWASRLCGFVAGVACLPYHALQGSTFGLGLCALGLVHLSRTIHKHDVKRLKWFS